MKKDYDPTEKKRYSIVYRWKDGREFSDLAFDARHRNSIIHGCLEADDIVYIAYTKLSNNQTTIVRDKEDKEYVSVS